MAGRSRAVRSPLMEQLLLRDNPPGTPEHAGVLASQRPAPARSHVVGGQRAHESGDELEDWCAPRNRRAVERGLMAKMDKVGPPTEPHIIRGHLAFDERGRPLFAADGPGPADYQGQLPCGKAVAMEAKSRNGRLVRDEHIPAHQQRDLDRTARGNGLAVLLYRCTRESDAGTFAIPWQLVPWRSPMGGRVSIGPEDVAAWRIDPRCELHPLDRDWRWYLAGLWERAVAANDGGAGR